MAKRDGHGQHDQRAHNERSENEAVTVHLTLMIIWNCLSVQGRELKGPPPSDGPML
jgi:hypothetical protein